MWYLTDKGDQHIMLYKIDKHVYNLKNIILYSSHTGAQNECNWNERGEEWGGGGGGKETEIICGTVWTSNDLSKFLMQF